MFEASDSDLQNLYVLMQPTRQRIVRMLRQHGAPMYVKQIADQLHEDERITSFHLATLAEHGFVEGEYRTIERPIARSAPMSRAAKFYTLTGKVREVTEKLAQSLE